MAVYSASGQEGLVCSLANKFAAT